MTGNNGPGGKDYGDAVNEMKTRDGLDRFITDAVRSGRTDGAGSDCPDDARIAAYIDGALSDAERDETAAHLRGCIACAVAVESGIAGAGARLEPPRRAVREAALKTVTERSEGVFEVAVRLVRDAVRMLGEAVPSSEGMLPAPIRGGSGSASLISAVKTVRDLRIELDIENIGGGLAEVAVGAKHSADGKPAQGLRASMFADGRELASIAMPDGRATFEEVNPGRYTINLTNNGFCLSDIELEIQKEPEDGE